MINVLIAGCGPLFDDPVQTTGNCVRCRLPVQTDVHYCAHCEEAVAWAVGQGRCPFCYDDIRALLPEATHCCSCGAALRNGALHPGEEQQCGLRS